jgi:hypothetical protein
VPVNDELQPAAVCSSRGSRQESRQARFAAVDHRTLYMDQPASAVRPHKPTTAPGKHVQQAEHQSTSSSNETHSCLTGAPEVHVGFVYEDDQHARHCATNELPAAAAAASVQQPTVSSEPRVSEVERQDVARTSTTYT